jgi:hypothetical protein
MIPDDLIALALADSVGALDLNEQAELAVRRASLSPEEQEELGRLYEVATVLATAVDVLEPPARVRQRVLASARTSTQAPGNFTTGDVATRMGPGWVIRTKAHRPARDLFRKPR